MFLTLFEKNHINDASNDVNRPSLLLSNSIICRMLQGTCCILACTHWHASMYVSSVSSVYFIGDAQHRFPLNCHTHLCIGLILYCISIAGSVLSIED